MKRIFWGVGVAAAAAAALEGCMPDSLEVGRTPLDGGGTAGEAGEGSGGAQGGSATAGNGGRAGAVAAAGGGAAGSAGERAAAGRGGSNRGGAGGGGSGGSSGAGNGGAGTSSAGSAGRGGDPRISFDAACDCTAVIDDDWGEFACTAPTALFDEYFSPPDDCEHMDHARKQACVDGTIRFEWVFGRETDYEMVFDGETLVYGWAIGYDLEEVCNFSFTDPDVYGNLGSVHAGLEPSAECSVECLLCESEESEVPWCPCRRAPDAPWAVTEPLESYCEKFSCPSTLEAARTDLVDQCLSTSAWPEMEIRTGCGLVRIDRSNRVSGISYFFDETTTLLVGASTGNDVPWGECAAYAYHGGYVPTETCAETTTCESCQSSEGAGGGAGEVNRVFEPCPP